MLLLGGFFLRKKNLFWADQATPGWRAAAASGIRDTPVNCLKIRDLVAVSQVLAGIFEAAHMEFKLDTITFLQAMCCLSLPMSNPIHLEGGRRWEGSPGTVAVLSRLVLAHCSGGIYGCRYMGSVCISGVSPWSSNCVCGCSGAGALGWVGGCTELPPL